jgi:hypothetical protein
MKFLADHCVYGKTVKLLRAQGHEVITLKELGQADAEDVQVLALAQSLDAVLITNRQRIWKHLNVPPRALWWHPPFTHNCCQSATSASGFVEFLKATQSRDLKARSCGH